MSTVTVILKNAAKSGILSVIPDAITTGQYLQTL
jgi:hypothetical protein